MIRRVAALYDIHGNAPALAAVLDERDVADADVIVVGGDVAAGPFAAETIDLLTALGERARFVRGNADRELVAQFDSRDRSSARPDDVWTSRTRFAAEQLSHEHRDFVAAFEAGVELELHGLGRTLFCHGTPRSDEEIVTELTPDDEVRDILAVDAALVVYGHTHIQLDRHVGDRRLVNAGSVGMPYEGRPGAYWALLGPDVDLRRTEYDLVATAERVRASGYPEADEFADENVLSSPSREEVAAYFESLRGRT